MSIKQIDPVNVSEWMTQKEVAGYFKISLDQVRLLVQEGKLSEYRLALDGIGSRIIRYNPSEVKSLLKLSPPPKPTGDTQTAPSAITTDLMLAAGLQKKPTKAKPPTDCVGGVHFGLGTKLTVKPE